MSYNICEHVEFQISLNLNKIKFNSVVEQQCRSLTKIF